MIGILWKAGVILALVYVGLRWFEFQSVYQPSRGPVGAPPVGGEGSRQIQLNTQDGQTIHAWFVTPSPTSPRKRLAILFCHGNAGHLGHRATKLDILLRLGTHILAFDYRGYGESTGRPSEDGTYQDADAAYQWLLTQGFQPEQIIVYGESLGGGIASWVAAQRKVGGLILQSTFISVTDLGAGLYPWLPVRLVSGIHYPTLQRMATIQVPVMVLHSRNDEIIPYPHGEALFQAAHEPKLFWELHSGHNDYLEREPDHFIAGLKQYFSKFFSVPIFPTE